MAAIQTLMTFKERKQALLAESELNRLVLQLEVENLRGVAASGAGAISRFGNRAGWLAPVLGAAGIFAGNKLRKVAGGVNLLKIAMVAVPLGLRLLRLRKSAPK